MKREDLKALGYSDDQIEGIMALHGKTVGKLQQDMEGYKTQVGDLTKNLGERDNQLAELSKSAKGQKDWEDKIAELTAQNTKQKEEADARYAAQEKKHLVDNYLTDKRARNLTATSALFDLEKISVKDGKLVGMDEQYSTVYQGNEYLFEKVQPSAAGREFGNNPSPSAPETLNGAVSNYYKK